MLYTAYIPYIEIKKKQFYNVLKYSTVILRLRIIVLFFYSNAGSHSKFFNHDDYE